MPRPYVAEALEPRRMLTLTITTADGVQSPVNGVIQTVSLDAGQTLNVDGVRYTGLLTDVPSPHQAQFQWDFGDPGSEYNQLPGFNASHVYEQPSAPSSPYLCKLTVTQYDTSTHTTKAITAMLNVSVTNNPDRQPFANNQGTLYVSNSGSSSNLNNCTPTTPVNFDTAMNQLGYGPNLRILFHRGETFTDGQQRYLGGSNTNIEFGAYGSGAAPVLNLQDTYGFLSTSSTGSGPNQVLIQDLKFDGTAGNSLWALGVNLGNDLTIRRCQFGNIGSILLEVEGFTPNGALVEDCTTTGPATAPELSQYAAIIYGNDTSILGNTLPGSQVQNVIRFDANPQGSNWAAATAGLVYGNEAWNGQNGVDANGHPIEKSAIDFRAGNYVYAANNIVHSASGRATVISLSPDYTKPVTYGVVQGNYFDDASACEVLRGAAHIVIQNNVFNQTSADAAIYLGYQSGDNYSTADELDISILNNTAYQHFTSNANPPAPAPATYFLRIKSNLVSGSTNPHQITMENNLCIVTNPAPSNPDPKQLTYDVYDEATDVSMFATVSNNFWSGLNGGGDFYVAGQITKWNLSEWNASFPQFSTDSFTDTEGTLLENHTGETGAVWAKNPSFSTGSAAIYAPNVTPTPGDLPPDNLRGNAANTVYYSSAVPASADYNVEADLYVASNAGLLGRESTSAATLLPLRLRAV